MTPGSTVLLATYYAQFAMFAKIKTIFRTEIHQYIEILTGTPSIQNGQFHTYCNNLYGMIHQEEKGLILIGSLIHNK